MENKAFLSDQDSIHSGEAILESLEKTIEDWELPRSIPVYALRDNSSNMKRAIDLSQALFDLKCFAHNLQLAINDAVKEILGVQNMRTNRGELCPTVITVVRQHKSYIVSKKIG